jgi:chorismate mutase/prephenate dehydratase
MIAAKDEPGLLFHILRPMNEQGVTMTRIESRPSKQGRWDYVFFIDMIGHIDDQPIANTMQEIQRFTKQVKVLGSYPKSV